ncbi:MAG: succinyl-diaminopimelate desuccinylase [Xanthomonadales bacterium]|nr:succinyl-diaminopimelate desuccinylase [Xanthomonadales bacterium]MBK7147008.1 succinyl-diaminopimelate desuccinylase [Xanthomonadales bacterium]
MSTFSDTIRLAIDLCARGSVTPADAGCQDLIGERLARSGFTIERIDTGGVCNLWAWHGSVGPVFAFLGHTDVVPTGDPAAWTSPPFVPSLRDGLLFARGAADMKGSVAAMVVALEAFVAAHPAHAGVVGLLLTSDEEGDAVHGTRHVVDEFLRRGQAIDYCVVGEPSSEQYLGDRIRIGRRGSLHGHLRVRGVQGHVAFPEKALNPIHAAAPALAELAARRWDDGNTHFPPTGFQISNIHGGSGAFNVIPADLRVDFNFRFGTACSAEELMRDSEAVLVRHGLDYRIEWDLSGAPFLTADGVLRDATLAALRARGIAETIADTGGGTSDGRFIATLGSEIVELGPVNASIHKIDEHVRLADLEALAEIYRDIAERVLLA